MEITQITPQVKDKTRCNVYVDGRFYCGLTLETVVKYRLKVGQRVQAERMEEIQLESEKNTALDKALSHLSSTRKTEKQIREFLTKKGYLPVVREYVVEKLREYGFLNDGEYAEAYLQNAAAKKGGRLIRLELKSKGVSDEEADAALAGLSAERELASAKALLAKYLRGKSVEETAKQKAYRYLLGKGFDYEVIKEALSELFSQEE